MTNTFAFKPAQTFSHIDLIIMCVLPPALKVLGLQIWLDAGAQVVSSGAAAVGPGVKVGRAREVRDPSLSIHQRWS